MTAHGERPVLCTKLSRCEEEALEMIQAVECGILPGERVGLLQEDIAAITALGATGRGSGGWAKWSLSGPLVCLVTHRESSVLQESIQ